ncbi:TIGR03618 family F420-dependent PPOX class oxidoreductase [Gordonia sp. HY002]|uniref:TIGR03618 family F420-dependent PPOX class oxidoreductase n=1 Tax=Gordonia zhenghanii TaxID=2911516 RepID=UPI001EF0363E|nr:TIGR03618 family F420-dependent PPOX class oxidoreductase [Gordonia zhenghanii]MCF8571361.1 TIGR03618 family F420-dependent PPOX class oxidoreductase [Gordonia zhenghanii]MCF8604873.1 TIGR03618 family F420-dependent PPOX class oxidoreductase [Gordonia zhenghanii]
MGTNRRSEIVMSDDEVEAFITEHRTATFATYGKDGIHLVAMWYAVIDGEIWIETKAKSQKAVNLRRDSRVTVSIEDGLTYDALRGVSISGHAEIYDDSDTCLKAGIGVWERYNGPYTDDLRPAVEAMMHKRVAVRVVADRVRSWDHRRLGLPEMPLAGSTAQYYE